jgi:isoleucyl-tRNA synthetase
MINITTSNNTAMTGTTTTSTMGTLTVSTGTNQFIYTGGNTNTFKYQPYTYSTSFSYPYLTMKSKAHIKQLRIVKRILRQNKVYASAGNAQSLNKL